MEKNLETGLWQPTKDDVEFVKKGTTTSRFWEVLTQSKKKRLETSAHQIMTR